MKRPYNDFKIYLSTTSLTFIDVTLLVVTRGHTVVTRGHPWSLVVTRGHSWVLLDHIDYWGLFLTIRHFSRLFAIIRTIRDYSHY